MSKTTIRLSTILLAVAMTMTLAGVAEAGNLTSRKAPALDKIGFSEPGGVLTLAWTWLTSLWTGTSQTLEKSSPVTEGTGTTSTASGCTNPQGCGDAGYGLDPNG
jgi:hypothetical protein